jgi:hypothetical protein
VSDGGIFSAFWVENFVDFVVYAYERERERCEGKREMGVCKRKKKKGLGKREMGCERKKNWET